MLLRIGCIVVVMTVLFSMHCLLKRSIIVRDKIIPEKKKKDLRSAVLTIAVFYIQNRRNIILHSPVLFFIFSLETQAITRFDWSHAMQYWSF